MSDAVHEQNAPAILADPTQTAIDYLGAIRLVIDDQQRRLRLAENDKQALRAEISALRQELREAVQNFDNLALEHDKCERELRETAAAAASLQTALRDAVDLLLDGHARGMIVMLLAMPLPALAAKVEAVVKELRDMVDHCCRCDGTGTHIDQQMPFERPCSACTAARNAIAALSSSESPSS